MDFCLQLIKEIRQYSELEVEFFEFYKDLQHQVENFMCSLLDQVGALCEQVFNFLFSVSMLSIK